MCMKLEMYSSGTELERDVLVNNSLRMRCEVKLSSTEMCCQSEVSPCLQQHLTFYYYSI